MGKTFAEKVLGNAAGKDVEPGEIVNVYPHFCMSHDNAAAVRKIFSRINTAKVWDPERLVFILDHAIPAPSDKHALNPPTDQRICNCNRILSISMMLPVRVEYAIR